MKVWIVNHYAITPEQAGGTRHYSLAKELIRQGYEVSILASSFDHVTKQDLHLRPGDKARVEIVDGVRFLWIRTPSYSDNSPARVLNMMCFAFKVGVWAPRLLQDRPDIVLGSSPHLFTALAAERIAARFDVPFIFEVRDLWPQSLIDLGNFRPVHPFIIVLSLIERFLYRRAAKIITLLPRSLDHIVGKGATANKVLWIPNGIDLDLVGDIKGYKREGEFKIIYAGTHGLANALNIVIQAAGIITKEGWSEKIRIILIGDGPEKEALMRKVEEMGLHNVLFEKAIPKKDIYRRLQDADVLLMTFWDSPLYRWGVSPNKIFDYMAVARPILLCVNSPNNPVKSAEAGLVIPPGDASNLARGIIYFATLPHEELCLMGLRGRAYVDQHHSMRKLGHQLAQALIETSPRYRQ